ncbi:PREDICTED: F-box protein At1g47056-like [Tarenaya hassleriana]|uniref:F-box protein At1g47056-like n=1 Tax=Tarenaya hassleriana TaxID=28532 RepID=UPI00053CA5B3|nr:PREDICTED: F-box protein At1g47056-like [Tarenaya hassleriana]
MGQSSSLTGTSIARSSGDGHRSRSLSPVKSDGSSDHTWRLPDECLVCVFQLLSSGDRKRCSLVCRRWMTVEARSRHHLSLYAKWDLFPAIPSLFSRFDSVTKLTLKCDRRSISIGDEALISISSRCRNLTRLKLRGCREITAAGMKGFVENCKGLRTFTVESCDFGSDGVKVVLDHCSNLEELSVKRLRRTIGEAWKPVGPGAAASSLKMIWLEELYLGHCFGPVIAGAKNLRTLKLVRCSGEWDEILQETAEQKLPRLVEIHIERINLTDLALSRISKRSNLEILHLVKTPECTNVGLAIVAEQCRFLKELRIDGWRTTLIGDEGLVAVAEFCPQLQELVLIGLNPTKTSLKPLSAKCRNLEKLALHCSNTVGDLEVSCIARKCTSLKKICIKNCPVSDLGIKALAEGCPGLVKMRVKKCKGVTGECLGWLGSVRPTLSVDIDAAGSNPNHGGFEEDGIKSPPLHARIAGSCKGPSSHDRLGSLRSRVQLFSRRRLAAWTLGPWSRR